MRRDVFQAMADPVRREIVQLLSDAPLTVNGVAEHFNVSRPAISKQLKVLNECGIIRLEQKGRERFCLLRPKALIPAFLWIDQYRPLWEDQLDRFEDYLEQLKTKSIQP